MDLRPPLSDDQDRVLRLLLTSDAQDHTTLIAQLPFARVAYHWVDDLPSINIELAEGAQRAITTDGALPVEGDVRGPDGEITGLILVWAKNGALAGLEYAWYTGDPPAAWPSSEGGIVRLSGR